MSPRKRDFLVEVRFFLLFFAVITHGRGGFPLLFVEVFFEEGESEGVCWQSDKGIQHTRVDGLGWVSEGHQREEGETGDEWIEARGVKIDGRKGRKRSGKG